MDECFLGYLFGYRQGKADERKKVIDDAKKLLDKITPDKVAEIKCDDGEIRNRPLIDIAKVYEILEQMKGE